MANGGLGGQANTQWMAMVALVEMLGVSDVAPISLRAIVVALDGDGILMTRGSCQAGLLS